MKHIFEPRMKNITQLKQLQKENLKKFRLERNVTAKIFLLFNLPSVVQMYVSYIPQYSFIHPSQV